MAPSGTSWGTEAQAPVYHEVDGVSHEVVGEGPHRIIFDSKDISRHEKAAGAKSEGLTFGPCCDYNKGKPLLLCQLDVVHVRANSFGPKPKIPRKELSIDRAWLLVGKLVRIKTENTT